MYLYLWCKLKVYFYIAMKGLNWYNSEAIFHNGYNAIANYHNILYIVAPPSGIVCTWGLSVVV